MKLNSWSRRVAVFLAFLLMINLLVYPVDAAVKKKSKVVKKPVPTYTIGLVAPISGNDASRGISMKKAFILAIEQAKAKAGNYAVKYVIADDKSNQNLAKTKGKQLISKDKVQTLIGSYEFNCTSAVSEVANAESIPLIAPVTTWPDLTGDGEKRNAFTFRVAIDNWKIGDLAAEFALTDLQAKKAAVIVNTDWAHASDASQTFQSYFQQGGGTIVQTRQYTDTSYDFKSYIKELAGKDIDVLFVPEPTDCVEISKEAKAQGIKCPILSVDLGEASYYGIDEMENVYMVSQCDASDPRAAMKSFVNSYKARWGSIPDCNAMLTYDATKMALYAVAKGKSNVPVKIKTALEMLDTFPGATGPITIDQYGDVAGKPGIIVQIKNGERVYAGIATPRKFQTDSEPWKDMKEQTVDGMQLKVASYPGLGYAMLAPQDWTKVSGEEHDYLVYFTPKGNDKVFLSMILSQDIYNILSVNGLDTGWLAIEKTAAMTYEDYKIISKKQITVNGASGLELVETFNSKGTNFKVLERVIIKNGTAYNLVYKAEASQFDKNLKAMRTCLDSLILFVPSSGGNDAT